MPKASFTHVSAEEIQTGTLYTQSDAYFEKRGRRDTIDPDRLRQLANAVGQRMLMSELPFHDALTDIVDALLDEASVEEKEAYRSAIAKIWGERRAKAARARRREAEKPFPKRLEESGQYAWRL